MKYFGLLNITVKDTELSEPTSVYLMYRTDPASGYILAWQLYLCESCESNTLPEKSAE